MTQTTCPHENNCVCSKCQDELFKHVDKLFMSAFRGTHKGTLNPTIRKYIKRGLKHIWELGYVRSN